MAGFFDQAQLDSFNNLFVKTVGDNLTSTIQKTVQQNSSTQPIPSQPVGVEKKSAIGDFDFKKLVIIAIALGGGYVLFFKRKRV